MGLEDITLTDIDFDAVENCTQPRVLRRYIALLEDDGGYFYQLLHAARQKLASLTGRKTSGSATASDGGASPDEIAAARQDVIEWQRSLKTSAEMAYHVKSEQRTCCQAISKDIQKLEDLALDSAKVTCGSEMVTDDGTGKHRGEKDLEEVKNIEKKDEDGKLFGEKKNIEEEARKQEPGRDAQTQGANANSEDTGASSNAGKKAGGQKHAEENTEQENYSEVEEVQKQIFAEELYAANSEPRKTGLAAGDNVQRVTHTFGNKQTGPLSSSRTAEGRCGDEYTTNLSRAVQQMSESAVHRSLEITEEMKTRTASVRGMSPVDAKGENCTTSFEAGEREETHFLKSQMRRVSVLVDEEEDTDECSDFSGSEDN